MLPKLIIFDWDDTLANTREAVVNAMNYVLSLYNLPEWEIIKKEKRDTKKSLKENFINFFGKENEKEAYEKYLNYYINNSYNLVQPTNYSEDFLKFCNKKNINVAIISNKDKKLLNKEVEKCFKNIKFYQVLGNGDAVRNKPAPDPVFKLVENFDFDLNENDVWLVGDTKQDTECALSSNCKPILIGKGKFMEDDYLTKNNNILVINSFNELIKILNT